MMQLHLPKIAKEKVNIEILSREPEGSIAVFINEYGRLSGVDQKGEDVAITAQNAVPVQPPADSKAIEDLQTGLSEAISKVGAELEEKFAKDLKDASKAFTDQLKQLQGEIKDLKAAKPAAKKPAAKKPAKK